MILGLDAANEVPTLELLTRRFVALGQSLTALAAQVQSDATRSPKRRTPASDLAAQAALIGETDAAIEQTEAQATELDRLVDLSSVEIDTDEAERAAA